MIEKYIINKSTIPKNKLSKKCTKVYAGAGGRAQW
jgi:hypothetical protein